MWSNSEKRRSVALVLGLMLVILAEVLRVYLIMPFPGSQRMHSIGVAYFLGRFIWPIRVLALAAILPGAWHVLVRGSVWRRVGLVAALAIYGGIFYFTNFVAMADRMFLPPRHVVFAGAQANSVDLERVVVGIARGEEARAYPIEFIGYHHQVEDEIAGAPLLVTYCTVCRTGRIFSPVVEGRRERFRLVGMDHFNAMFEDGTTRSWWRQVSGEAVAGPRKGMRLAEIPSEQMTLREWLSRHPRSGILQPDPDFQGEYRSLRGYDDGTRGGSLTGRRNEPWQEKSWVAGVVAGDHARAYDWNDLVRLGAINDRLGTTTVAVWVSPDGRSLAARSRTVNGRELTLMRDTVTRTLTDAETRSTWNDDGLCTGGPLQGTRLDFVQSYQEFWHSWRTFHPGTDAWKEAKRD